MTRQERAERIKGISEYLIILMDSATGCAADLEALHRGTDADKLRAIAGELETLAANLRR